MFSGGDILYCTRSVSSSSRPTSAYRFRRFYTALFCHFSSQSSVTVSTLFDRHIDVVQAARCSRDCLKLYCCTFLGSPTQKVGTALSFTAELFRQADEVGRLKLYCCPFFQPTILSNGAEDARQIYTRGSVLGKARNRNSENSPTSPLIFTWGQNV